LKSALIASPEASAIFLREGGGQTSEMRACSKTSDTWGPRGATSHHSGVWEAPKYFKISPFTYFFVAYSRLFDPNEKRLVRLRVQE